MARTLAPARLEAPNPPPDLAPPPANAVGPLVIIGSEQITIEGKTVGLPRDIDGVGRLQKIDNLFDTLQARRTAWKAAHPDEPFVGAASLVVAPGTSGLAFASVYQTIAFAGFPTIHVAVASRYHETMAQVPRPPCGAPGDPCASGPPQYVLNAEVSEDLWRLRVLREDGPLEANGEGPRSSAESFRVAASSVISTANVGAIILHIAPNVPFARLAPFLGEAADLSKTAHLARVLTLSVREMGEGKGTGKAAPISATGSESSGRLAPELIQKVVRGNFARLRECYERALARDPSVLGKAATRFVIARDGTVSEARTTLSGSLPPDVGPCVEAIFKAFTFEAPSGGIVTVTYPIMFAPAE